MRAWCDPLKATRCALIINRIVDLFRWLANMMSMTHLRRLLQSGTSPPPRPRCGWLRQSATSLPQPVRPAPPITWPPKHVINDYMLDYASRSDRDLSSPTVQPSPPIMDLSSPTATVRPAPPISDLSPHGAVGSSNHVASETSPCKLLPSAGPTTA